MSRVDSWADQEMWSVGEVARRLGLPASTLRTWERRYGIGPSARSAGGHRRYIADDAVQLEHMATLVAQGVPAAEAARAVHRAASAAHEEIVRDPQETGEFADAIVAAARAYDSDAIRQLFLGCLVEHPVTVAWHRFFAPSLRRVGDEWSTGGLSVGGEHLVSDNLITVLRAYAHERMSGPSHHRSVLLASAEDDEHALPLLAVQAALVDEGIYCHLLGSRTPASSVAGVTLRLRPAAVFLWASLPRSEGDTLSRVITSAAERTVVLLGGPGWDDMDVGTARRCATIDEALQAVRDAVERN
ncbi:MerR family transcriptional regulator [Aeromicrobium halocynthiae]|uniref:MerR family transcriptional regulator n=1 Tax=Aeromicrobium halocynthiae TaxID=560557 RepID=UPI0031D491D1